MEKFASFDIFDTSLLRLCGKPSVIFDIMADSLFAEEDRHSRTAFLAGRAKAELRASKMFNCPDIMQIYDFLDYQQFGFEKNTLVELEMFVEESQLISNTKIACEIEKCRTNGCKIVFISDMYLPSSFLKKILMKYELAKEEDSIFVSCEWGSSKYNGKLFEKVLDVTKSKAKQWRHFGDNLFSDYVMPRKYGMASIWYQGSNFNLDERNALERALFYHNKHQIERYVGLCRAVRVCSPDSIEYALGINLVASLYIPYVYQVLLDAKRRGFNRLYFIGRDGKIFLEIAKQFVADFQNIDLRYIKMSRKVIYASSFYNVDEQELLWFLDYSQGQRYESIVEYMGLDWKLLSEKWKSTFRKDQCSKESDFCTVLDILIHENAEYIRDVSCEKRGLFLSYLKQEGVFDDNNRAFVDLGWAGTTRVCINNILKKEGRTPIFVYYYGASSSYLYGNSDNDAFIFQKQKLLDSSISILLLEHYASMNVDGSVVGYKKNGDVVEPIEGQSMFAGNKIVAINECCCKKIAREYAKMNMSESANEDVFLCCGYYKMESIEAAPSREELDFISELQSEDYGNVDSFVKRYSVKDIVALCIWGVPSVTYWDAASRKKTFGRFDRSVEKLIRYTSKTKLASSFRVWWEKKK